MAETISESLRIARWYSQKFTRILFGERVIFIVKCFTFASILFPTDNLLQEMFGTPLPRGL
jgi:hypothetical protein